MFFQVCFEEQLACDLSTPSDPTMFWRPSYKGCSKPWWTHSWLGTHDESPHRRIPTIGSDTFVHENRCFSNENLVTKRGCRAHPNMSSSGNKKSQWTEYHILLRWNHWNYGTHIFLMTWNSSLELCRMVHTIWFTGASRRYHGHRVDSHDGGIHDESSIWWNRTYRK